MLFFHGNCYRIMCLVFVAPPTSTINSRKTEWCVVCLSNNNYIFIDWTKECAFHYFFSTFYHFCHVILRSNGENCTFIYVSFALSLFCLKQNSRQFQFGGRGVAAVGNSFVKIEWSYPDEEWNLNYGEGNHSAI